MACYENLRGRQLSPDSCAETLDVSTSQVHRWIRAGEITAAKLGDRCTRIDGDTVADFLIRKQAIPRKPRGKAAKAGK
jgi:excisionase family DNA binding protein